MPTSTHTHIVEGLINDNPEGESGEGESGESSAGSGGEGEGEKEGERKKKRKRKGITLQCCHTYTVFDVCVCSVFGSG